MTHASNALLRMPQCECDAGSEQGPQHQVWSAEEPFTRLQKLFASCAHFF